MEDPVNHPKHYTSDPSGVECIEIVRHKNFNIGNAIKYLWRAGLKNEDKTIEDLKKAIFYINDEINRLSGSYDVKITDGVDYPAMRAEAENTMQELMDAMPEGSAIREIAEDFLVSGKTTTFPIDHRTPEDPNSEYKVSGENLTFPATENTRHMNCTVMQRCGACDICKPIDRSKANKAV